MIAAALQERVAAARRLGREPLAVLDVDLTLVDNAPRNRAILGDWAHSVRERWPGADAAAVKAQTMPIVFGVQENLRTLGVSEPELAQDGLRFWLRSFFDGVYCRLDTALPGAVEAVEALRAAGVTVIYLTARPAQMAEGTVTRMQALGFPIAVAGTALAMKPDKRMDDGAHKEAALEWIGRMGVPILCADNEPGHVNAMMAAFPGALSVLVQTRHSGSAPPLASGAGRAERLLDVVEPGATGPGAAGAAGVGPASAGAARAGAGHEDGEGRR